MDFTDDGRAKATERLEKARWCQNSYRYKRRS
jgi:hypothetical protein